jgi:hypothetical protein
VPKAYPLEVLAKRRVLNDRIGETEIVLVAPRGTVTVRGASRSGRVTYEAGGEVRAFQRNGERFRAGPGPDRVRDQFGRSWRVTEEALVDPGGRQLSRLEGHLAYWFGWFAFFPRTQVYGGA